MAQITAIIKGKKPVTIDNLDLQNNTLNDLLSLVKEKAGEFSVNLVTIAGEDININDFNKKLKDVGLEDEDVFTISDYYDGGILFHKLK